HVGRQLEVADGVGLVLRQRWRDRKQGLPYRRLRASREMRRKPARIPDGEDAPEGPVGFLESHGGADDLAEAAQPGGAGMASGEAPESSPEPWDRCEEVGRRAHPGRFGEARVSAEE